MQTLEIRRSDLNSDSSDESNSHDPELEARFREQLSRSYDEYAQAEDKDRDGSRSGNGVLAGEVDNEDEEVYEFRLFKKSSGPEISNRSHHIFQKIALRSPTAESGEPGFLKPRRPDNYYFTGDANAELVEQYQRAAVSGAEILEGLKARWQGHELPWRVTIVKSAQPTNSKGNHLQPSSDCSRKKRSGKKRRIAIRKKLANKSAKEAAARQSQVEKEGAEREKRTRRNREKKVKKKQKEKLKKSEEA